MFKSHSRGKRSRQWHLYWVESDFEGCFVVARNARSARSIEMHMNCYDFCDVHATKILRVSANIERAYLKDYPDNHWPGQVYGRKIFEKLGAQFRMIDGEQEMLLDDVVYVVQEFAPYGITRGRVIGQKAVSELRSDPHLGGIAYFDEDMWDGPTVHLITALGMCLATCQLIEHYIAHSFLLGISKKQKQKYKTLQELARGWKKKSFGNMLKCIEEAWEIEPTLKANLEVFLANRNLLVHGIIMEDRYNIRTHWGREELVVFLNFFDIHARVVKRAFRSSYYASVHFGFHQWGRPKKISRRVFGRKHEKEGDRFFYFFKQKDGAI